MGFGFWGRDKNDTAFEGALGDAHFAIPEEAKTAGLLGEKGIRLGYYRGPDDKGRGWGKVIRYNGDAHLITVAPTGTGKGRDVLVGALLEYEGSCIVIDPKGQLAAITKAHRERPKAEGGLGQKVIVLNPLPKELPMDLGSSARYNPMASLDPESDAFGPNCEAIADSIVKHEEGPNSHFSDSARQLIAGIIMHLAAHGHDGEKNLVMMQKLVSGSSKILDGFIAEALKSDKDGFVTGKLARFHNVTGEDRELRSIISTANTQCGFINNKAIGGSLSDSDFSFRDLKREPTTVYLVLPAKYIEPCGKWFRLVLASAISELWSEERGKYPVLAILDEFAQLGRLSVIADAMGMARGFGLQLWPILQDLTQLKEHYGDRWETFLGGAAVRQFFGPREHFTAEYVSKLCGVKTVVAQGQSVQHAQELFQKDHTGESWGQHGQPLLHPHNVSALGPEESLVLGPQNIVIDAFRKPFYATEELAVLASPDPYHKQDASLSGTHQPLKPPAKNFAEREWAAAQRTKSELARKSPLFLRLLKPGRSDNPYWNVARKIEYLLTLPLRLLAALVAAPFAIHNRPLAALIGFLALFGFWEVFDALAKQPLTKLFEAETAAYQEEVQAMRNKKGEASSRDMLYSNYRAAKFVIGAEVRALKAGLTNDGTRLPNESGIDYFMRKMSRSLDLENQKAVGHELSALRSYLDPTAPTYSDPTPVYPEQVETASAEAKRHAKARADAQAEAEKWQAREALPAENTVGLENPDYAVIVLNDSKVRYLLAASKDKPLNQSDYAPFGEERRFGGVLPKDSVLVPYEGEQGSPHAGLTIHGVPAYLFRAVDTGQNMLVPKADIEKNTKHYRGLHSSHDEKPLW